MTLNFLHKGFQTLFHFRSQKFYITDVNRNKIPLFLNLKHTLYIVKATYQIV